MASARFRLLERRLHKLRQRFLPAVFSPTGDYADEELDHARGYRLLAHAEIEAFIEDRCREIANATIKTFRVDRRPRTVLLNILSFHPQDPFGRERLKTIYGSKKSYCEEALTQANTSYNRVLAKNQGIREENVLKMLLPLGLEPTMIDATWLNTLDTFGVNRGNTAHTSIGTQQQIDPQDEMKTVEALLQGLQKLDELMKKLK